MTDRPEDLECVGGNWSLQLFQCLSQIHPRSSSLAFVLDTNQAWTDTYAMVARNVSGGPPEHVDRLVCTAVEYRHECVGIHPAIERQALSVAGAEIELPLRREAL
jgi:hypothetical protein